jgi:hypothetical protein
MTCSYCGNEHGMIKDIICPILNRFPYTEYKEKFFAMEVSYPYEVTYNSKLNFEAESNYKKDFKNYLIEITHKYVDAVYSAYPSSKQQLDKIKANRV